MSYYYLFFAAYLHLFILMDYPIYIRELLILYFKGLPVQYFYKMIYF